MSYNFKQYDSRWAKKSYCTPGTMASDGCGPTAVADLVYNLDKTITPWKVAQWMTANGYATRGNGTVWSGITMALRHYGFEVMGIEKSGKGDITMTKFLNEMAKGDRWGIILFKAGTKGGVTWTMGGHYMAAVDYRVVNSDKQLYMYDSGTRGHNGWYSYTKTMRGLCALAYITVKKPKKEEPKKEEPKLTAQEQRIKDIKAFAKKYADDDSYKYRKWSESNKYSHQCPLCHPNSNKHATKGWNCRGFVSACLYHGGKIKTVECSCKGLGLLGKSLKDFTLANFEKYNGKGWKRIYNSGKSLKLSQLQDGDVIFYFDSSNKMKHVAIVYDVKNGKIADSTSSKGIKIRKPSGYGYVAFRYVGK